MRISDWSSDVCSSDLRYWNAIVGNGGQESQCGWCKDKWGLSWQITPRQLMDIYSDPDPAATQRAFEAMMGMQKIDIAKIEAARRGDRKSTRLNSSHSCASRIPSSA